MEMTLPSVEPRTGREVRRIRRRHRSVPLVAAAAALGAAASGAAPTGVRPIDIAMGALFAAAVSAAASVSRRWTWLVLSGVAVALPSPLPTRALGAAALVMALAAVFGRRRTRPVGALVGALAVQALLRLDPVAFHGCTAMMTTLATAPVLVTGYRYSGRSTRRLVGRALLVAVALAVAAAIAFAVGAVQVRASAERGLTTARQGLAAAEAGDTERAAERFAVATTAFGSASATFSAWWMQPARAVPVLGQHLAALRTASTQGAALADATGQAARTADVEQLTLRHGRVDLDTVRGMADPLRTSAATLERASRALAGVDSPWLADPIRDRLRALTREIDAHLPDVELAAQAADALPRVLGADEPARYLVLFANPAEARELGGILGNYAELTADDGELSLTAFGRNGDLNRQATHGLTDPDSYPDRFVRLQPWRFAQNLPGSPDLPTVAKAVADLYPRMGGRPVDGVLYLDPFAVAGFLELTGPIEVTGTEEPLTAEVTADFLLRGQYERFASQGDRTDMLADVSGAALQRLLDVDLPGPERLGELFGPLVRAGRLQFLPFDEQARQLADRLGLSGDLPPVDASDFLAVVHANAGANKLDAHLRREVHYDAVVERPTGDLTATATVVLHNEAPAGLPAYVLGAASGDSSATMHVQLSVYTPHRLVGLAVDGRPTAAETQWELGRWRYVAEVAVERGTASTVTFELEGAVEPGDTHRLMLAHQPLADDDEVTVAVRSATPTDRLVAAEGGAARWELRHTEDLPLTAVWDG